MAHIYRGFEIFETTGQINARPTTETKTEHSTWPPVAARDLEQLHIVLDYLIDEYDR